MTLTTIKLLENDTPKYRQLAAEVERLTASGALAAGERIPGERVLADRLGVSVITVNRAMAELMSRGVVERRVGSGTFVRASGKRRKIGFFWHGDPRFRTTYSSMLFDTLWDFWSRREYDLVLLRRKSEEYEATIREYGFDGVLIRSPREEFVPAIRKLRKQNFPAVVLSSIRPELAEIGFGYSGFAIVEAAVDYLAGLGHSDIGFILPESGEAVFRDRREGFRRAMWKKRLPINPEWTEPAPDMDAFLRAMLSHSGRPGAIIIGSTAEIARTYQAIRELGLRIPEDISVVCIDEDEKALEAAPPPSVFRVDIASLALEGSEGLLALIEGREIKRGEATNFEFVDRHTCMPPTKGK